MSNLKKKKKWKWKKGATISDVQAAVLNTKRRNGYNAQDAGIQIRIKNSNRAIRYTMPQAIKRHLNSVDYATHWNEAKSRNVYRMMLTA